MVTSANYSFNIAHCISYSMLGFWCMWLKVHHPLAFYTAQLSCTDDDAKLPRLMQDALNHGIEILPPHPVVSRATWHPEFGKQAVRAGLTQIPGIAATTAGNMLYYRDEDPEGPPPAQLAHRRKDLWPDDWGWAGYAAVRGIGPKKIAAMEAFANDPDPFGLLRARTTLQNYRNGIRRNMRGYKGLPSPTHASGEVPDGKLDYIVWMGFCISKNYQNAVEKARTREGKSEEEILATMRDPHLLDSCVLRCYDDGPEDVYLRVDRWRFPALAQACEAVTVQDDIVIAIGRKRADDFGVSIMVDDLIIITPTDEERGIDHDVEEAPEFA
jgi:DNA polymerase-3 subunit alpha